MNIATQKLNVNHGEIEVVSFSINPSNFINMEITIYV